jgi:hypothetical protein
VLLCTEAGLSSTKSLPVAVFSPKISSFIAQQLAGIRMETFGGIADSRIRWFSPLFWRVRSRLAYSGAERLGFPLGPAIVETVTRGGPQKTKTPRLQLESWGRLR